MQKITNKYRKRVYNAVIACNACEYTVCKKCPYHSQGCKDKLLKEAGELLTDYHQMLREMTAAAAAANGSGAAAPMAQPLI